MRLSIIIPCYNCEKTLEESVNSCYAQGLAENDFEVVMVDDASKDSTPALIGDLARRHGNIRSLRHATNQGGGAARNNGIRESRGDFIYCLDSDNFFGLGEPLKKMLDEAKESGLDGVSFYERRFFAGNDSKRFDSYFDKVTDRDIELKDLFRNDPVLLDNFLFSKKSYLKTKGYPENHGFDTQCFEVRYLAAGNRVRACEDTIFYHRQVMSSKSYFEREYDSGNFSKNYFLIMEDIFGLLSPEAQDVLLNFDIFSRSSMDDNLMLEMRKLQSKDRLFKKAGDAANDSSSSPPDYLQHYESSLKSYTIGSYAEALKEIESAIRNGLDNKIAHYHKQRCLMGLDGMPANKIDAAVSKLDIFKPQKQKLYKFYHRMPIIKNLIANIIKWKKAL